MTKVKNCLKYVDVARLSSVVPSCLGRVLRLSFCCYNSDYAVFQCAQDAANA